MRLRSYRYRVSGEPLRHQWEISAHHQQPTRMGLFAEFSSNCLGAMMQTGSAVLVVKRDGGEESRYSAGLG